MEQVDRSRWYRVRDTPHPPLRVHIRLQVEGRTFIGSRERDPRTGNIIWIEHKRGQMVLVHQLDFAWALWQPTHPDKWQGLLPEPVATFEDGRLYSEKSRFGAVDDATSEELAAEMHRDRMMARDAVQPEAERLHRTLEYQWWLDRYAVRYDEAPNITIRDCEARVMRALAWCGGEGVHIKSTTPAMVLATVAEVVTGGDIPLASDPLPRFQPADCDVSDFDRAMAWFVALNPVELRPKGYKPFTFNTDQRVLLRRASLAPRSFAEIGAELAGIGKGLSVKRRDWRKPIQPDAVRKRFVAAIEKCWRAANGHRVHRQREVQDQMSALRERNRKYRGC